MTGTEESVIFAEMFEVETLADNQARLFTKVPIRGKVGNYSLTLRARDQGFPIQNAMEKFNVCVFDVNDHSPVFIKPPQNYTIRIPEVSPPSGSE